jgi:signal transduction histidine kinase/DNA-binding response OmpR family regulator
MNSKNHSLKDNLYGKLTFILFLIAGLLMLVISVYTSVLANSVSAFFKTSIENRIRATSRMAARLAAPEELAALNLPSDMQKPLFQELRSRLMEFGEAAGVEYVYFMRPLEDGTFQFIVDNDPSAAAVSLESPPVPGEEAPFTAVREKTTAVSGLGTYSKGYTGFISAFSPVLDKDGAVAALAGVDIWDEEIFITRRRGLFLAAMLLASSTFVIVSGFLNAVIHRRKEAAFAKRFTQQELMSGLSQNFVSSLDTSALIQKTLRITGEFMRVSRIMIDFSRENTGPEREEYSWFGSGGPRNLPKSEALEALAAGSFPPEQPKTVPAVFCGDTRSGPYREMRSIGVTAFIWAPIYVDHAYWAVLSFEECLGPRAWTESDRLLVKTVSSVIAGAIARNIRERERDAALYQAEQASRAKGNFLANMSHEMRTPMNAIIGMTTIGKASRDLAKKEYCLGKIEEASTHLLGVINNILDMSKIEADKFELSFTEFEFEKMLRKVVSVLNFRVEQRRQDFSVQLDKNIPRFLYGDDQRLAQVITNILSNAVKFTPENGSVHLDARLAGPDEEERGGEEQGCAVLISVKDSGIGISGEQSARLFSSFEQADSSTSRKFGGTGLGLALSKRIVELMGGRIWVESEPGKGATFSFIVKLGLVRKERAPLLRPGLNWSNLRILAVDDAPYVREFFQDFAEQAGIVCGTAASGEEAEALIRRDGPFDLYFIDWKMPGINGIDLSRRIKERDAAIKPVVIMISNSEWNEIEEEARSAGVDKFLPKPLFPSLISDCINECLGLDNLVHAESDKSAALEHFAGRRALLAEDMEINREIVMTLLEPTGLRIDCAENGIEAVKRFSENPDAYDIIFMDVQMPEMDGYEATRRIRALNPPRRVPIIAMTANVFREDIEKCLAAGMDGHIGKPIDIVELQTTLHRHLSKKRPRRPRPRSSPPVPRPPPAIPHARLFPAPLAPAAAHRRPPRPHARPLRPHARATYRLYNGRKLSAAHGHTAPPPFPRAPRTSRRAHPPGQAACPPAQAARPLRILAYIMEENYPPPQAIPHRRLFPAPLEPAAPHRRLARPHARQPNTPLAPAAPHARPLRPHARSAYRLYNGRK